MFHRRWVVWRQNGKDIEQNYRRLVERFEKGDLDPRAPRIKRVEVPCGAGAATTSEVSSRRR